MAFLSVSTPLTGSRCILGPNTEGDNPAKLDKWRREIDTMKLLDNANIVRIIDAHEELNKAKPVFVIVMELMQGGDLLSAINSSDHRAVGGAAACRCLPEKQAMHIVAQVLGAIEFMHLQTPPIAHRDLKPENVLLSAKLEDDSFPLVKVCDFGLAREVAGSIEDPGLTRSLTTGIGTPAYSSPEVLRLHHARKGKQSSNGTREIPLTSDVWGCGIILYCCLSGEFPFHEIVEVNADQKLQARIIEKEPPFLKKAGWRSGTAKGISTAATELVKKLLLKDETKRVSASDALQHTCFDAVTGKIEELVEAEMERVAGHYAGHDGVDAGADAKGEERDAAGASAASERGGPAPKRSKRSR
jgi:serine/threonine protein kinase